MEILNYLFLGDVLPEYSAWEISIRIVVAFFAGSLIGLERESQHQPAGIRTHALISGVAALMMIVSYLVPYKLSSSTLGDPGRIAAQVISGIGFLGAGAILKMGSHIRGLTTAASMWGSAGIGLAFGAGFYGPATIGLVLIIVFLHLIAPIGRHLFPSTWVRKLILTFDTSIPNSEDLSKELSFIVDSVKLEEVKRTMIEDKSSVQFIFDIENKKPLEYEKIYEKIKTKGNLKICFLSQSDKERDANLR